MLRRLYAVWYGLRVEHALALLALALLVYFGSHLISGSRGWFAFIEITRDIDAAKEELERLRTDRADLEGRIQNLRLQSIDPDLLDELARGSLALVGPGDVIILLEPSPEGPAISSGAVD